jgi:hypothetical protein
MDCFHSKVDEFRSKEGDFMGKKGGLKLEGGKWVPFYSKF